MKHDFVIVMKAVIVKDDCVLVLRRSAKERAGSSVDHHEKWDLPGGSLHFFEKMETGLRREIKEETNLKVVVGTPISNFDVIRKHIHLCIITCACKWAENEVCLSDEHEAFFWLTQEEVQASELPTWMKRDIKDGFERAQEIVVKE